MTHKRTAFRGVFRNHPGQRKTNQNKRVLLLYRTCIALIGHLKPRNVAIATIDSAANAVDSWKVKKFLIL